MMDRGEITEALPLLRELRDPMIEAGEHDKFLKSLSIAVEKLPGQTEPLEMMAEFCRHTSDPFPLNSALSQLCDAYLALGDVSKAEEVLQEMVERNKDDERLVERLNQLRNGGALPKQTARQAPVTAQAVPEEDEPPAPSPVVIPEEPLDEETQLYVSQALTDVDLFSSYGLTQKATHLLESVLERAPRHTPTLERLLDMHLGAGNERRTAELAAQLEQIHRGRGDAVNADRFAELRRRFQEAAGITDQELAAPMVAPVPVKSRAPVEPSSVGAVPVNEAHASPIASGGPAEFEIPIVPMVSETEDIDAPVVPALTDVQAPSPNPPPVTAAEEVDLSDEWEAMVQEVEGATPSAHQASESDGEVIEIVDEPAPAPLEEAVLPVEEMSAPAFEIVEEIVADEPAPKTSATEPEEIELLLTPEPATAEGDGVMATTQDLINQLVAELDELDAPMPPAHLSAGTNGSNGATPSVPHVADEAAIIPETSAENLNELAGIFQEFRSDLGEQPEDEEEDLETHYNLGIAYREMGLLDEAIGEFQKVAKAVQKGRPFAYAMNCSTLLALTFMDKGEPKIASLWYKRALEVPALDPETILALRYDLAVSLETAGESSAALDSFRQVYAMNIDYRDVADHIATLQKV